MTSFLKKRGNALGHKSFAGYSCISIIEQFSVILNNNNNNKIKKETLNGSVKKKKRE